MKSIQQRNQYINQKMQQLDEIADANKYGRRLAKIMLYHKLLTGIEVAAVRKTISEVSQMKETTMEYCAECHCDFTAGEIVHFTWFENRCFCDKCKQIMNTRVTPSYLEWQLRKVTDK